jgi:hypothetical protein
LRGLSSCSGFCSLGWPSGGDAESMLEIVSGVKI